MATKYKPERPSDITKRTIEVLKTGCEVFFPIELGKDNLPFGNIWKGWERSKFASDVYNLTEQDNIKDAYDLLLEWLPGAPETITPAKQPDRTKPQNLEELVEALDKAKTREEELRLQKEYQLAVQRRIEGKSEEPSPEPTPAPIRTPVGKRSQTSEPTTTSGVAVSGAQGFYIGVTGAPSGGPFLLRQIRKAAGAPLREFMRFGTPYLYAESPTEGTKTALVLAGITPDKLTRGITKEDVAKGISPGKLANARAQAAAAGVSESLFNKFIEQYSSGSSIKLTHFLTTGYRRFAWHDYLVAGEVQISSTHFPGSIYISQNQDGQIVAAPSSIVGNLVQDIGGKLFGRAAGSILKNVITGGAKAGATAAGTGAAAGAAGGAAAGAATTTGAAAAGAAAGTALAPGVGTAIGFVVGFVISLGSWFLNQLKKNKRFILELIGGGLVLSGFLVGGIFSPVLIPAGGLLMLSGLDPGFKATSTGMSSFTSALLHGITHVVLASIAAPFIISTVVLAFLFAIIIFIINSSAFVIPGDLGQLKGGVVSPYIEVRKTANKGTVQNSELPVGVEYTIEISAKKGNLTNIRFDYLCDVVKEASNIECPGISLPNPPDEIAQGSPYSFKYGHTYDSRYTDSLIVDTITVFADAPEKVGAKSEASASVVIGSPPQDCPSIWPTSGVLAQGAYTNSSHFGAEAIDISRNSGGSVSATHGGVARVGNVWPWGKYVEIESICGTGGKFFSRYAHLSVVTVSSGARVRLGEQIGLVGNTGNSTGPHLHYEFRGPSGPKSYPNNPPFLMRPYVPKDLPRNCVEVASCKNTSIP